MVSPFQSLTQTCPSNGNYSFTIGKSIDGQYIFRVSQTNPSNPVQSPSVSKIWTRDTIAPDQISLVFPSENPSKTSSAIFSLVGYCEANSTVNISATVIPSSISISPTTTSCSSSGKFNSLQNLGSTSATDGDYNYSITQTDASGNTSTSVSFVWKKTPTASLALTSITSPALNPDLTYVTNASTPSTYPNISVSCSGTNTVTIVENGVILTSGTCASSTYTYQVPARADGLYQYDIYQTDTTNKSPMSSFTWIRDTLQPNAPTITTPSTSSVTTANLLVVAGDCVTDSTVSIQVDNVEDSSTKCIKDKFSATVSRAGNASYSVTAVQKDVAQNTSAASNAITWTQSTSSIPMP
ncbi:hypothetical protein EBR21_14645, partial [bacterium]|nr:hypothetical protein [bacterium]